MMIAIGNFLFRYRNGLFPAIYALLLFDSEPLLENYWLALPLGFLVACAGQLLRAITIGLEYIVRGGRNHQVYAEKLVQGGMFAHCRNPLYVGNFLILLGVGIASNSLLFLSVAIPFFLLAYTAIIAAEENYLQAKFGQTFTDYCSRVNRLVPNLAGFRRTLHGMRYNWRRLITAEYGSSYIWLAATILVTLKNLWLNRAYHPGDLAVAALWAAFAFVTLAYGVARFLKKKGFLNAVPAPALETATSEH
jgi:protein-S-isoprenylcysteine O-methyltransferase Ste14